MLKTENLYTPDLNKANLNELVNNRTRVVGVIESYDKEMEQYKVRLGNELYGFIPEDLFSIYENDSRNCGKIVAFYIESAEEGKEILLDRRSLMLDTVSNLKEDENFIGSIVKVTVVLLLSSGAVVDIKDGIRAFIPLRNLSRCYIREASDVLRLGQNIRIKIEDFDIDKLCFRGNYKVTSNASPFSYKKGQIISGVVRNPLKAGKRVTGHYVEIAPNVRAIVDSPFLEYGKRQKFKVLSITPVGLKLEIA